MRNLILLASTAVCAAVAFMSEYVLATVKVVGQDGNPLLINQSDYDANPDAWKLWEGEAPAPEPTPLQQAAPHIEAAVAQQPAPAAPVQYAVTKKGKAFFVVNMAGDVISDMNGDAGKGYSTDAEAWAAIMAAMSVANPAS